MALGIRGAKPYIKYALGGRLYRMCKKEEGTFIYQGSQSSQHQKNNLLQAIFFAWLGEGRTGPMVIKDVAAFLAHPGVSHASEQILII